MFLFRIQHIYDFLEVGGAAPSTTHRSSNQSARQGH